MHTPDSDACVAIHIAQFVGVLIALGGPLIQLLMLTIVGGILATCLRRPLVQEFVPA